MASQPFDVFRKSGPAFEAVLPSDDELRVRQGKLRALQLQVRKPDSRIFEAALDGLRLPASEVVHIGDDVVADVAGAKAVGMRAIWFNTGFWRGAKTDRADGEIRGHAELPRILEKWR